MNFSEVSALSISEGEVVKITCGDDVLWQKKAGYTNLLPLATDTDRTTIYNGIGYKSGVRLSSSGSVATLAGVCASGFIPAVVGDVLRIKNTKPKSGTASYVITYDSTNAKVAHKSFGQAGSDWYTDSLYPWLAYENGILTIDLSSTYFGTGFDAIRFSAGTIDENTIVTVNEEIT